MSLILQAAVFREAGGQLHFSVPKVVGNLQILLDRASNTARVIVAD
jgi:hypothetical protein